MSNHIYEKEVHPGFTGYELFKSNDLLDSIAIPEVFEENEELQEDDPLWLEEIEEEEELIELPVPEDAQEEQKQEEERQQQENETQLDEESIESESGLTKEKILEEVQDEGIARELIPGARTLFSGQLGSIPWVVDAQGKLILGSGVFDETNNIGGRYAATDYFNHPMYSQAITSVQLTGPIALRELNGSLNISGDIRRGFFTDLRNVREIEGIEFLDTSGLREMSFMFANMSALTSLDVSGFDTSNVRNMQEMFQNMSSLTELDVSGFDTYNVWSMQGMFQNMSSLTELDVSSFDTTNLFSMTRMFEGATGLTRLDVSGLDTGNVVSMIDMFRNVSRVTELNVSGFDTSQVILMQGMFDGATNLMKLDVSNFDTSLVENMQGMFRNVNSIRELDVSGFDTSSVRNMSNMFQNMRSVRELDVSSFDTSLVENMTNMFTNVSSVTELDVSGFDTSNVTMMSTMFAGMSSVRKLDASSFDTSNIETMINLFSGLSNATELNVSNFNTSRVVNMSNMFNGMGSLVELDVSSFDTSRVVTMTNMFNGMSSLVQLDASSFDTRNVVNMSNMFNGMSSLTELDVSGFDTGNVTNMSQMFMGVSSLTDLDVSSFVTHNVTNMQRMFNGMSSLTKLDISRLTDRGNPLNMFSGAPIKELTIGSNLSFIAGRFNGLWELPTTATHRPFWRNVGTGTSEQPNGSFMLSTSQLIELQNTNPMAETWVQQPRNFVPLTVEVEGSGAVTPTGRETVEGWEYTDITAMPAQGWRFSHWEVTSGDGKVTENDQAVTTVLMGDTATTLTAVFEDLTPMLSVRIPSAAVFGTTADTGHTMITSPDYEVQNLSPFKIGVDMRTLESLDNMEIIQQLNLVVNNNVTELINQGIPSKTEAVSLFNLDTNVTNTFSFTGTANLLPYGVSQINPTFNMILRFVAEP
ncbi:BspA family leucine-rich repeat surface protein [Enterococcus mundtii]|nr:BspA family leucine-rich repeat surface protein [Enterococcus mundtii]